MSFATVIGHARPLAVLQRAIHAERISHAYLFCGPPSVGKTLVAREFAKAVNCETNRTFATPEEVAPCDQCAACTRIDRDIHPDVHVVRPRAKLQSEDPEDAADVVFEGSMITTDQIGELVAEASMKANQARRKVFIVCSAEGMNPTAANRLLKTLEEPPGDTTLILTTQNLSGLLPTIISRCQLITFRPTALAEATAALQARVPATTPGALKSVVALSGGRIGAALHLLQHPAVLELREKLLTVAASLPERDWFEGMAVGERFIEVAEDWWLATQDAEFAERALKAGRDRVLRTKMNDVLDILLGWFRDLALLAAGGAPELVINADHLPELMAAGCTAARCRRACDEIEVTRKQLRGNSNLRLTAEVLAFRLISACR